MLNKKKREKKKKKNAKILENGRVHNKKWKKNEKDFPIIRALIVKIRWV